MSVRTLRVLALSLVLVGGFSMVSASVRAEDAPPAGGKGEKKPHGNPVEFILKHADDLKLTDEQKTKLEALGKEIAAAPKGEKPAKGTGPGEKIKEILTPDQMAKLKELRPKDGGPKKDGEKKPEPTK